jgi:hypothetical protein
VLRLAPAGAEAMGQVSPERAPSRAPTAQLDGMTDVHRGRCATEDPRNLVDWPAVEWE